MSAKSFVLKNNLESEITNRNLLNGLNSDEVGEEDLCSSKLDKEKNNLLAPVSHISKNKCYLDSYEKSDSQSKADNNSIRKEYTSLQIENNPESNAKTVDDRTVKDELDQQVDSLYINEEEKSKEHLSGKEVEESSVAKLKDNENVFDKNTDLLKNNVNRKAKEDVYNNQTPENNLDKAECVPDENILSQQADSLRCIDNEKEKNNEELSINQIQEENEAECTSDDENGLDQSVEKEDSIDTIRKNNQVKGSSSELVKCGEEGLVCPMCFEYFSDHDTFNVHLHNHNCSEIEEKDYLTEESDFERDKEGETLEQILNCVKCNFECSHQDELRKHLSSHFTRHMYFCSYKCGDAINADQHIEIHKEDGSYIASKYATSSRKKRKSKLQKKFMCMKCGYLSNQSGHLSNHMRTHTGLKPYNCEVCDYRCRTDSCLKRHAKIHTGEKPFQCMQCSYSSSSASGLKVHVWAHSRIKPYKCVYCRYSCVQRSALKIHIMVHTGEKPFSCDFCSYKCSTSCSLKRHIKIHATDRTLTCQDCDYTTNYEGNLRRHRILHTGEKPFACSFCDYKTGRPHALKSHMRVHTGEKPYFCNLCDYRGAYMTALKNHMMSHTGERPYSCTLCDYKCKTSTLLKKHSVVHMTKTPVKCNICSFECPTSTNLKRHMRSHTEKLHICATCGYCASHKSALKIHERTHTGEKPFVCKEVNCNYASASPSSFKRHLTIHKGKPLRAKTICVICSLDCRNENSLKWHLYKVHNFSTSRALSLKSTPNQNCNSLPHEETVYKVCHVCGFSCKDINELTYHMGTHQMDVDIKPLVCSQCGFICVLQNELQSHMLSVHHINVLSN